MVCVDLEGVLFPEIWVAASRQFGIEELSLTTRDVPDYDRLMAGRLALMKKHGIRVRDIVEITANMEPLEGALDFLDHLRGKYPTVIATDSFEQFLGPVKEKLRAPVLFCNALDLDDEGNVAQIVLRSREGKRDIVRGFKSMGFFVFAVGDSHNDVGMLKEADVGYFFQPPAALAVRNRRIAAVSDYEELRRSIEHEPKLATQDQIHRRSEQILWKTTTIPAPPAWPASRQRGVTRASPP